MKRRVLVAGANGMLGTALTAALRKADYDVVSLGQAELDVTDAAMVNRVVAGVRPACLIDCAGFTRVDDAETERAASFAVNAGGAENLAAACHASSARFVYPSTDYVFDGLAHRPYPPAFAPNPLNTYGRSKLAGEAAASRLNDYLVVRTSWLFGPGGRNFVRSVRARLARQESLRVVSDQMGRPSYAPDVAEAIVRLLDADAAPGTYHVCNSGMATWFDLAREVARLSGCEELVSACTTAEYPAAARRPAYSVLDCTTTEALVGPLRPWQEAVAVAVAEGML